MTFKHRECWFQREQRMLEHERYPQADGVNAQLAYEHVCVGLSRTASGIA